MKGIIYDPSAIDNALAANLRADSMERFKIPPKDNLWNRFGEGDQAVIVDHTYPAQIAARLETLNTRHDWVIGRVAGEDVVAAEKETFDHLSGYILKTYSDYFKKSGDVISCALTGVSVDTGEADPLDALGVLLSEDVILMMPQTNAEGETEHYLKAGALVFPNDWSLTSKFNEAKPGGAKALKAYEAARAKSLDKAKLGKSFNQIHVRVPQYKTKFNGDGKTHNAAQNAFNRMKPLNYVWRQNWLCMDDEPLYLHFDKTPEHFKYRRPQTKEGWEETGHIRSEHQTLVKLPETETIAFLIKTNKWKLTDMAGKAGVIPALQTAYYNAMQDEDTVFFKGLPASGLEEWMDQHNPRV